MNEEEILAGLREILRERMGVERPLGKETRVLADLELDSLRRIELLIEVENRFRVRLEPEDEEDVRTLGDLARVVAVRRSAGASSDG
ncbi:MAG: acyl carrier protein [Gemmatimonadota bacterium]